MHLSEIIEELSSNLLECGGYRVAVLCRKREHHSREWGELETFAVFDIAEDEVDKIIYVLTNEHAREPAEKPQAFTVEQLLEKLRALEHRCGAWSVFSGSARVSVGSKWEVRYDVPLVGIATNHPEQLIGFLQFPEEQWQQAV